MLPRRARRPLLVAPSITALVLGAASPSRADEGAPAMAPSPAHAAPYALPVEPSATPSADVGLPARVELAPFTFGGYAEAFYQWNFNRPWNGLTHARGFDNRHDTFTISNVALDAQWDHENLVGRLTLQVGHTPSTYYLAEPVSHGTAATNGSNADLWKFIQQAYAGYRFGVGRGLTITGGLFLSPVGPETIPVKDSWNWSRSNLFFFLPYYHAGVRAAYPLTRRVTATIALYNGWNSVVDGNDDKSVSAQFTYARPSVVASVLYLGGVERPRGASEGRPFRHLFDAHATWDASSRVSFLAHANAGFERTSIGTSDWAAGALYARLRVHETLWFAARGDVFYEHVASNTTRQASPIFAGVPWVASRTLTADFRPHSRVSFRLEARNDVAARALYFGKAEGREPSAPTQTSQNTVTLGVTSWF